MVIRIQNHTFSLLEFTKTPPVQAPLTWSFVLTLVLWPGDRRRGWKLNTLIIFFYDRTWMAQISFANYRTKIPQKMWFKLRWLSLLSSSLFYDRVTDGGSTDLTPYQLLNNIFFAFPRSILSKLRLHISAGTLQLNNQRLIGCPQYSDLLEKSKPKSFWLEIEWKFQH